MWSSVGLKGTQDHDLASNQVVINCELISQQSLEIHQIGRITREMECQIVHGRARALARRQGAFIATAPVSSLPRRQRISCEVGVRAMFAFIPFRRDSKGRGSAQRPCTSRRGNAQRAAPMVSEHQRSQNRCPGASRDSAETKRDSWSQSRVDSYWGGGSSRDLEPQCMGRNRAWQ